MRKKASAALVTVLIGAGIVGGVGVQPAAAHEGYHLYSTRTVAYAHQARHIRAGHACSRVVPDFGGYSFSCIT